MVREKSGGWQLCFSDAATYNDCCRQHKFNDLSDEFKYSFRKEVYKNKRANKKYTAVLFHLTFQTLLVTKFSIHTDIYMQWTGPWLQNKHVFFLENFQGAQNCENRGHQINIKLIPF